MYDVVIMGGGLYGASTAYHLLMKQPDLRVCVVERDPTYEYAASVRSLAGVRILFSQAESIRMSQYGHEFYASYPELMAIGDEPGDLFLNRHGYLILAVNETESADIRVNFDLQTAEGCTVELHDSASLKRLRPSLNTSDIPLAVYSPNDMTADPNGALMGLRAKARALGAHFQAGSVCDLEVTSGLVRSVVLEDGQRLDCDWAVNSAGAWAPEICRMLGLEIPVVPWPKMVCFFECREALEGDFGVTTDSLGGGFRPSGTGYLCMVDRKDLMGQFSWEPKLDLFESEKWAVLAHRVPAFEAIKLRSAYCCHYAYNTFDGNLLLGAWPGQPDNFLLATGASGHGFQHAPAAGRALSELIVERRFQTLDLQRFGCARVVENRPDPERGFTA